jgi:alcohol dehydrogenase (cytochrome c)
LAAGTLATSLLCSLVWAADPSLERFTPVGPHVALNPAASDWLMWRRTYNSWGYSPLDQINKRNVGNLQLAWAWTQELGNQEAAPLVRDGVMYLAQSNNVVHALDGKTGSLIWEYRHPLPKLQGSYVSVSSFARATASRSMARRFS